MKHILLYYKNSKKRVLAKVLIKRRRVLGKKSSKILSRRQKPVVEIVKIL